MVPAPASIRLRASCSPRASRSAATWSSRAMRSAPPCRITRTRGGSA